MKKSRKLIFFALTLLIITGMLFGYVPQGFAQDAQTWTEPVNLSLSGIATSPLLVIDSNQVLHAIWIDQVDGYKYSQSADGITWTKPQTARFPFDEKDPAPLLLADANGNIHIFWINADAGLFYGQTRAQDFVIPTKWRGIGMLAADVSYYAVNADPQGALHLAYIRNISTETEPAGIYYRQYNARGGSWSKTVKLYESEYFRSTTAAESFISVAASSSSTEQNVYVTWDIRPQKRVFMSISHDAGLNWSEAKPIKSHQDTGGVDSPFNLSVAAVENKALLLWQVGEPGTDKCSAFSQWSEDGGESWQDTVAVFGGPIGCPTHTRFFTQSNKYIVALMTDVGDANLIAWDGERWSEPQAQTQLPAFSSPLTLDAILLGYRFDLMQQDRLYMVGCDQGPGGDVWFLSRSLESLENWFLPQTTWGVPATIVKKTEKIRMTNLVSVADTKGNMHLVWVQSSSQDSSRAILYARWSGRAWTEPSAVVTSLNGMPVEMSAAIDPKERLLVAWVDGNTGELLFNWANADRANLASEWQKPIVLPSPSTLNSAPDVMADGSGRIVVVFAVSLNEERGIYIVQSTDSGRTWSAPVRVFDAASAGWEEIGNPKIGLTQDGVLHLVFSRKSVRIGQPVGLYYFRSLDGGATWTDSQILSEGDIKWSDMVSYDDQTVQVLWQEFDGLVFANMSKASQDSGVSWERPLSITGVNDVPTPVTLAADGLGTLHFVQLLRNNNTAMINQDRLLLQDWQWTGSGWEFISSDSLLIRGQGKDYALTADVTATGFLGVSLSTEYFDPANILQNEILSFKRFLQESSAAAGTTLALIPTPALTADATIIATALPTQAVDLSVLNNDNVATSPMLKNIAGLVMIVLAVVVTAILLVGGRKKILSK